MPIEFHVAPAYDVDEVTRFVKVNMARGLPTPNWRGHFGTLSICGNGPSLRDIYPSRGPIAALNGAWKTLVAKGVMPDYIVAHDPAPENVAWFDDCPDEPIYLLGSTMQPAIFDQLVAEGKHVVVWHVADAIEQSLGLNPLVGGGFTIGCKALNLFNLMGFTHFELYGYDSCYALDGAHHATEQEWNCVEPQFYQVDERMFAAAPWMAAQVQEFLKQLPLNKYFYTVNIHGDGFLAAALEHNTLDVVYDLETAPGSFDFMCSLLNVENYREGCGYSRARIFLKPGSNEGFRPNDPCPDFKTVKKLQMINHVVRPLIELFGMEEVGNQQEGSTVFGGIEQADGKWMRFPYSPRPATEYFKQTGKLPTYHASPNAMAWAAEHYGNRPYVITLREAYYWPQRNSNVDEWVKFARTLDRRVVFVRDTEKALETLEDCETCPEASVDLHKRLALYRHAEMNFFVTNGPAGLAWYSRDIPYINFYKEAPGYHCYAPEWLEEYVGLPKLGQLPWHDPMKQRLVYADDTFENIRVAFDDVCGKREKVAA